MSFFCNCASKIIKRVVHSIRKYIWNASKALFQIRSCTKMNEKQMSFVGLCKNGAGYWPHGRFGPQYRVNKEV